MGGRAGATAKHMVLIPPRDIRNEKHEVITITELVISGEFVYTVYYVRTRELFDAWPHIIKFQQLFKLLQEVGKVNNN